MTHYDAAAGDDYTCWDFDCLECHPPEAEGERFEIWTLHESRQVRLQPSGLGVPVQAVMQSDGTIGGTHFERNVLSGPWSHDLAWTLARGQAAETGYKLDYFNPSES